ncbi:unnamed protein product [Staurois parvus]|uniref:Uncharacterized protein n=1 Tax=Staurois parvus TaxID=386267 RepID=A0ABN9EB18_9NEOB|nr:unnamed protein product [Staurois parvus]
MTRDCGCTTGDDQTLRTQYRRRPETVDIVQEIICTLQCFRKWTAKGKPGGPGQRQP